MFQEKMIDLFQVKLIYSFRIVSEVQSMLIIRPLDDVTPVSETALSPMLQHRELHHRALSSGYGTMTPYIITEVSCINIILFC